MHKVEPASTLNNTPTLTAFQNGPGPHPLRSIYFDWENLGVASDLLRLSSTREVDDLRQLGALCILLQARMAALTPLPRRATAPNSFASSAKLH
mmetsp:Transcript_64344/g.170016  ORF Transcript_64344/g.170016 Transcript_64344/m.170016 type:complete len:94 (-) Transcript_64344:356-637(-)